MQNDTERVLGYYSKSLNSAQRYYCTIKKELLAIVATLAHWDVYLSCVSKPFVLRHDHVALTWLKTMACKDKAMLRWCDAVNKYKFIIQHRSGAKHRNADVLSRVRLTQCGWTECPDCKVDCNAFANEDESVLPRSEELIVKLVGDVPLNKAAMRPGGSDTQQAVYKVISMITGSKIKA